MTQEELNELLQETEEKLRELAIPLSRHICAGVRVNSRAKRRLGCCILKEGEYTIEVAQSLLEQPEALRQTLCHELLHTCPGCRNHGKKWKAYAALVNEALGMDIRRLAPAEPDAAPLRQEQVRYLLRCESCGRLFPRSRMSKAVKTPWRYRCPCGGRLKRIQ